MRGLRRKRPRIYRWLFRMLVSFSIKSLIHEYRLLNEHKMITILGVLTLLLPESKCDLPQDSRLTVAKFMATSSRVIGFQPKAFRQRRLNGIMIYGRGRYSASITEKLYPNPQVPDIPNQHCHRYLRWIEMASTTPSDDHR
jgi:hypothetical protein